MAVARRGNPSESWSRFEEREKKLDTLPTASAIYTNIECLRRQTP